MSYKVDKKDFALAVVSGNPVQGDPPDQIAENALNLYFSAIAVAEKYNKENGQPSVQVLKPE
ncbi:hypothetical protein M670_00490 [Schinkia azotoformans MEV2011]|uniref:Uncharacterized protein n=1 Tax=Schinkia azotoformans MEV2011 TaxID=1348973 RepID=A0A072NRX3_SCHAZ|nr:hypothetical protein [Schinkia azotoformans]KEF40464.1 hypothetical protein M670_00490 [Schinkia azotoformans MEV2011]MEC1696127.1 hypothetical protein [Schinkia azotoformans]MEC1716658.1 hypothetical protein [Schinkia azotoformans]MEC1725370.1 hypothetical protein [Schinkia azotoformans]MEC1739497.1 hypothetical protein [Schinkia azotoformans]